ncbi:hypothetical protein AVEN_244426-1, partial [Araneus ventricosus]
EIRLTERHFIESVVRNVFQRRYRVAVKNELRKNKTPDVARRNYGNISSKIDDSIEPCCQQIWTQQTIFYNASSNFYVEVLNMLPCYSGGGRDQTLKGGSYAQ